MSTETNTDTSATAAGASAATTQSGAQSTTQAPAKQKYEVDYDPNNPPWLSGRLKETRQKAEEDARAKFLAELGTDDPETAKKLIAEEKKRAEERKSLETKHAEVSEALKTKDARNKELESSVKVFADGQLALLSEPQKAAVLKVAGEDPAKQLNAIEALRPTWAAVAPAAPALAPNGTAPSADVAPPVVVPPVKLATATAPPAVAPPPAGSTVVPNHLEIYDKLNNQSSPDYRPFAASAYLLVHGREIEAARKARGSN